MAKKTLSVNRMTKPKFNCYLVYRYPNDSSEFDSIGALFFRVENGNLEFYGEDTELLAVFRGWSSVVKKD
jgi:hypothetical protein